jgi:hypothetical protein
MQALVITEADNDPKVVGLVYVAAFAPGESESINSVSKPYPPAPVGSELRPDALGFLTATRKGIAEDIGAGSLGRGAADTHGSAPSTAIVVSNSNPAAEQSAVKFTATVSSSAGTPSGTVKFLDGTSFFLECRLARDHGGLHRSHELRLVYQRGCETGGAELQLDSWIGGRKREQRRWR